MIDKQSGPENPEIVEGQRIFEEMKLLAGTVNIPKNATKEPHKQFGNNFHLLFLSLQNGTLRPGLLMNREIYLGRIEKQYGPKWQRFLEENQELVAKILETIKEKEIYDKLYDHYLELLRNPKTRPIIDLVDAEINIEAIGSNVWNKLNPLLIRASEQMSKCGIKPEEFYG